MQNGQLPPVVANQAQNASPVSMVELHVRAKGLANRDVGSLSDPFCVLKLKERNQWVELGRTSVIQDTLDPDWPLADSFIIPYHFEEHQQLMFEVYDCDTATAVGALSSHDFLGRAETRLGTIVCNRGGRMTFPLTGQRCKGSLEVTAVEQEHNIDLVQMRLRVVNVDKKDIFGKSDPYICISRHTEGGMLQVYRSEVHWCTYSCTFMPISERLASLAQGDLDMPLLFHVWDCDKRSEDDFIGQTLMSLRQLAPGAKFPLINDELKGKRGYQNSGVLEVLDFRILKRYTFLEYVSAGLQAGLMVGIDYTASNKPPNDPQSLHFMGNGVEHNQYAQCLHQVVGILSEYDADQEFPVFGFGAKVNGRVSHCFPANLRQDGDPTVQGIDGIMSAYLTSCQNVQFHGPTLFAPLIRAGITQAQHAKRNEYLILLILTDGVIMDMNETKAAIVAASRLPISIIIVGVGNADFGDMDELDADDGLLVDSFTGNSAARDIVQFVAYNYVGNAVRLAAEVLREIPTQVTEYMAAIGVSIDEVRALCPYHKQATQVVLPPAGEHVNPLHRPQQAPPQAPAPVQVPVPPQPRAPQHQPAGGRLTAAVNKVQYAQSFVQMPPGPE